jgi:hypothetical protein
MTTRGQTNENCAEICVTLCVTRACKNAQIRDYPGGRQQLVNDFKYSKLSAPDVVRRFLQKCRFALRKPPFYPLNYGDTRFRILDCGLRIG